MKINQPLIIVILFAALVACAYWAITEKNKKNQLKDQLNAERVLSNPSAPLIKRTIDSLGRQHAVFNTSANKIGGKLVAVSKPLLDSVARQANTKPEQIINWQLVNSVTEGRALKAERIIDSLKQLVYYYKDKFVQLSFKPSAAGDTINPGTFDFKYSADLSVTQYSKRSRVLGLPIGKKNTYTDIYSNDPRTTINGFKTFSVQQKEPSFGFRLQAVSSYSVYRKSLLIGPGVQFDVGRFSLVGTYYYDPKANNFSPAIGTRYDIFK